MLCALRRVLKEAQRLGLMSTDDYAKAVDLPAIKETRELKGRAWLAEEIHLILAVLSPLTTSKYDRRGEAVKRKAVQKLHLRQQK